ncbi:right-handed parallel beta-helix repeat-containing protein [Hymenobacter sp. NBH84]|uniref:right-handed parallel beta-helix repeat-containing protein n=1 Tax=Hymenobacter sp. NBH84 TaxID=2596915 RepID=UPI001627C73F|nr:right-handed parallel beta-helix repeat-containing protein [Hymenobacter sp. NBH84]QNE41309.1 right-handed parallel beta-helix repeat-containing protein [Hymenobacter sp. NBH84]
MRYLLLSLFLLSFTLLLLPGCEPKADIVTTDSSARLEFSQDTVLFDTVFVRTGTATRRLWVYNRNPRAVRVEQITLANPGASPYRLLVGGDAGPSINNVEIRGRDSLLVLVRATIDPTPGDAKPFIVTDDLRFRTNGNDQQIALLAYGQNAYFHNGETLPCNTTWTNDKPHVIYNSVRVDSACTLTMQPGTRVYSHAGSILIVAGTLRVNPDYQPGTDSVEVNDENIVRFAGDRLEPFYDNIPGQWAGIQFLASSHENVVRYAEIKNAAYGLLLFNYRNLLPRPAVRVENTVIRNISGQSISFASAAQTLPTGAGVLSLSGDVEMHNCLITNCGEYAVLGVGGGNFTFDYCTIANYRGNFNRSTESLTLSNEAPSTVAKGPYPLRLVMRNSIVWGGLRDELLLANGAQYQQVAIQNSLLQTERYKAVTSTATALGFGNSGNVLNQDPKFRRTPNLYPNRFDYRLGPMSPASNKAVPLPTLPHDLLNAPRDPRTPDMGAYERAAP